MQHNSNPVMIDASHSSSVHGKAKMPRKGPGLKNLAAFHELMTREGFCLPDLSSKFVNQDTLS